MDSGAEHIRETRAKILAAKKEIKEYLRLPEDARGLLILTHGKGNVIFLSQENLPTGAERKYTWEEHSGQYATQLITVYDYESMYMTAVDVDGNESATFVCLCLAQEKGVRFALERNKRMKNDYAVISNHGGICIVEQTRENRIWLQLPEPNRNLMVKNEKIDMDYEEDLEGRTRMRMSYTCKHPEAHQWPFTTLSKWEAVEWNEGPRDDSTASTGDTLSTEELISKE
jgi:hypothetical protein